MPRSQTSRRRARLLPLCTLTVLVCAALFAASLSARRASARSAATFFVTNTEDTGPGSLRQAIIDANNSPGADTIAFNIQGTSRTIQPVLSLPPITDPVVLDGTTQPGFAGTPIIELNGAKAVSSALGIGAPGTVIRGLVINGFNHDGIGIGSAGGGSRIEGCYIGTDVTGTVDVPNFGNGISILSSNNVIGGTTPDKRNVISGNSAGIQIEVFCCTGTTPAANGNVIQGNYIGLNAAGNAAIPNREEGVRITTSSGEGSVTGNVIGGSEPGAGNVISGNRYDGIVLGSFQTTGNVIKGNLIGADATGTFPIPNSGDGIRIDLARNNVIGGPEAGARNVVSGNSDIGSGTGRGNGIALGGSGNVVRGNYVGLNAAGSAPIPNLLSGVSVGGSNQTVGGSGVGEGNTIAFNGLDGIVCANTSSANNSFRGNSIFSNGFFANPGNQPTIGIDIGGFGVTQNDSGDSDTGANGLQNFPVITSVTNGAGGLNVKGTLNSAASTTFALDFYSNAVCDATGYGEGARRIGSANVTTNAGGDASFDVTFPFNLPPNQIVTATATDPSGNTSEFSQCSQTSPSVGSVGFTAAAVTVSESVGTTTFTVNRSGGTAGTLSVNYSVVGVTATAGTDFTSTQGTLTFADGETSKSFNVPVINDSLDEPFSETAKVTLSTTGDLDTLGTQSVATLTITDDDPSPGVSVGDVSAAEGNSNTTDFNFPVTLNAVSARDVTITYATADGTAGAGTDYVSASGSLVIPAGQTSGTITVKVLGDANVEPDETFTLSLTGATNGTLTDNSGQGTILNDDLTDTVAVAVGDVSVTEGGPGTTTDAVFTVALSKASDKTVTVDVVTVAGTAADNIDFVPVSTQLSFAPGDKTKTVAVTVKGDNIYEGNETFHVELRNASNATVAGSAATGTILDDETQPTLSVGDVTVTEGNSGATEAAFIVTLSGPSSSTVSFQYKTQGITAQDGEDFTGDDNGFASIAPGQTSTTVVVPVIGDTITETDEVFYLHTVNPTGATITHNSGLCTIKDDESTSAPPTLQFSLRQSTAAETFGNPIIFVTRSGDASQPVTVRYATRSGSGSQQASDRTDYTPAFGTLRFGAGETSKTFTVLINEDSFQEGDEFFSIDLSDPTGGASIGEPSICSVKIIDQVLAPPFQNPIDFSNSFVRQHYHDFLNREPDAQGLAFWTNEIEKCGADQQCREVRRINVSAAFFLSIEFQETGYLVERTYKTAFGDTTSPGVAGTVPVVRLSQFLPDTQRIGQDLIVGQGDWQARLEANKQAYMLEFVQRPQGFAAAYPSSMTAEQFVDRLAQNAGLTLTQAERDQLLSTLGSTPADASKRAQVLRAVAENPRLRQAELNRAFVLMEYYGYMRRNPDDPQDIDFRGWKFWLDKLNQFNGDFVKAEMVKAFISSDEYRHRFGQ